MSRARALRRQHRYSSPPTVRTVARWISYGRHGRGYWALTVPACPYCGKKHFHGGGGENPDRTQGGHRVAHCIDESHPDLHLGYVLAVARERRS